MLGAALPIGHVLAAADGPTGTGFAQFAGYPWGGGGFWPGGFPLFGPDVANPYLGSPGYPYYRYGPYYGNAYGLPYPVYPSVAPLVVEPYGPPGPAYPSAGGVAVGSDWWWGGYQARCLYSSLAGIGGSWNDPPSYGYFAPFC
jgi:hypothetical protein